MLKCSGVLFSEGKLIYLSSAAGIETPYLCNPIKSQQECVYSRTDDQDMSGHEKSHPGASPPVAATALPVCAQ